MSRPRTLRAWVAGLVQCTAALVEHLGLGLDLVADVIAPHPAPNHDEDDDEDEQPAGDTQPTGWAVVVDGDHVHTLPRVDAVQHTLTDDCTCGPWIRCAMTGRGDVWHIRHHRLQEDA